MGRVEFDRQHAIYSVDRGGRCCRGAFDRCFQDGGHTHLWPVDLVASMEEAPVSGIP